jgi:hypothetical protein
MGGVLKQEQIDAVRQRLRDDTPYWAEKFGYIIDKRRKKVSLQATAGQAALDAALEEQRAAGKPMRALSLKARQVGISTWSQAKLIQRATQREHYDTVTVAHDRTTGRNLFRMGRTIYENLPEDPELGIKPPIGQHSRGQSLHFGDSSIGSWGKGDAFPNSTYLVDTAKEFSAGRGSTYAAMHLSEVAFWDRIGEKLMALQNAIPDEPETLVIGESTANGHNEFKDIWDDAVEGRSDYYPFFWAWWQHEEYRLEFANEKEREAFSPGEGEYGEEEPDLIRDFGVTLEQLHWRRRTIANKCGGDLRVFDQEYPSTPEKAFLSTGQKVFDPYRVAALLREVEQHDPKETSPDNPGPAYGEFEIQGTTVEEGRTGDLTIPTGALWVPRESGPKNQPWRMWVPDEQIEGGRPGEYIIGVDVSGGMMATTDEPDYQAIQVINHQTRDQVAEYRSRCDPDELAEQILLAALFFNGAVVAVERTGGWGLPVLRTLLHQYHYPMIYRAKRLGATNEKTEHKLGWDTNTRTKTILVAGMQVALREDNFAGIKSRRLASEVNTYVKDDRGRANAAPKAYDDLLMAYMIAQFVASERPVMAGEDSGPGPSYRVRSTGLSAYDGRYT